MRSILHRFRFVNRALPFDCDSCHPTRMPGTHVICKRCGARSSHRYLRSSARAWRRAHACPQFIGRAS